MGAPKPFRSLPAEFEWDMTVDEGGKSGSTAFLSVSLTEKKPPVRSERAGVSGLPGNARKEKTP